MPPINVCILFICLRQISSVLATFAKFCSTKFVCKLSTLHLSSCSFVFLAFSVFAVCSFATHLHFSFMSVRDFFALFIVADSCSAKSANFLSLSFLLLFNRSFMHCDGKHFIGLAHPQPAYLFTFSSSVFNGYFIAI